MSTLPASPPRSGAIDPEATEALGGRLGGRLIEPGQAGYDAARSVWNGMIDKRPALIVRPGGVADVMRAIEFAREHALPLSIKGGGHNVAGHAVSEGGLMLDMSGMRGVHVDPARRVARVQGGATWADFDRETGAFGLATTGGVISTTGVAGLTLGGGVGWLMGKHGLSIDNLLSVDLVTSGGEFITASESEHPDLFWALRGGGGNFGVATSFEFRLHHQGPVLGGLIAYPVEHARDVAEFYREFTATAPDELRLYMAIIPEPETGTRIAAVPVCYTGDDLAEGERLLAPLMNFGRPVMQMVEPMPYPVVQTVSDPLFPHGQRYYWKGNMLSEIPDGIIDAMVEYATDPPLPQVSTVIELYGGQANRVGATETAYPHREARYQMLSTAKWDDPTDDEKAISWARGLHQATERFSTSKAFLNFHSADHVDGGGKVRSAYGPNWERLVEVKRRYDPTNFFRENNNIDPGWRGGDE